VATFSEASEELAWLIDLNSDTASHDNGVIVKFSHNDNKIMAEIIYIPAHIKLTKTRQKTLLKEACEVYKDLVCANA